MSAMWPKVSILAQMLNGRLNRLLNRPLNQSGTDLSGLQRGSAT